MKDGMTDLRLREIPVELKAKLKAEAALAQKTLNDYVVEILQNRKGGK